MAADPANVLLITHDLDEAIYLSDRVIFSARPGRVIADIAVDLERPRQPDVRKLPMQPTRTKPGI